MEGFTEQAPNTVIRSQMEAGPAKVRRRFTSGTRNFDCQLYLSPAQVETHWMDFTYQPLPVALCLLIGSIPERRLP